MGWGMGSVQWPGFLSPLEDFATYSHLSPPFKSMRHWPPKLKLRNALVCPTEGICFLIAVCFSLKFLIFRFFTTPS